MCGRGETVDTGGLKPPSFQECGFESRRPHHGFLKSTQGLGMKNPLALAFLLELLQLHNILRGGTILVGEPKCVTELRQLETTFVTT